MNVSAGAAWLLRHPHFHLHFTPNSSSWLNLVERWFAELTCRKLRRSAHRSVTELQRLAAGAPDRRRPAPPDLRGALALIT
jgi:transposase